MKTGISAPRVAKADLHVHSKHSDRPTEWFLRRIGAPECFTEPEDVYRLCRQKGMDYVTISDHNCIAGSLEIAHLPGTFISAELTTYFPEDGCKIHCLVQDITERQFADMQTVRQNIYDLRKYLADESILHVIAHPLFRVNDVLTVDHVEKLLLLFERFESTNGSRHPRAGDLTVALFSQLTAERIGAMADRHGLRPYGETPWVKRFTGGSDDHSGLYGASAYTVTPPADTVQEFLEHLRAGRHGPCGTSGTSLRLAHSLYNIAYQYYRSRIMNQGTGSSVLGELFKRLLSGYEEPEKSSGPIRTWAERVARKYRVRKLSPGERLLVESFAKLRGKAPSEGSRTGRRVGADVESFATASRISHELGYVFLKQFLQHVEEGRLVDGFQTLASMGTVMLGIAPYFTAFGAQHKDERFLQDAATRLGEGLVRPERSNRRAWVTDTFSDVNGVSNTIRMLTAKARDRGWPITVMTSMESAPDTGTDTLNFPPLGSFSLPEYDSQKMVFPPFLDVIEALERGNYNEVIISTPGPMGLTALAAARLLGIRPVGIYHTDFPKYVKCLTQDEVLEQLAWRYMQWFYGQMDRIHVPSEYYRKHLVDNGFDGARLKVMPRGVDLARFNPAKRDTGFWKQYGLNGNLKLLYVGRVSREKNIKTLMDAFQFTRSTTPNLDLVVVGDGPELADLRRSQVGGNVCFTGVLQGEELAIAYASADLFVFPSASDTFGNVVLEAHASGLPAIVSTQGGPAEIVARNGSGLVVDVRTPAPLCAGIRELVWDGERRAAMGRSALKTAHEMSWDLALDQFT
jgi:glycosyltransferase involved in cell wall biosynthesis